MIPEEAKSVGANTTVSTTTVVDVCESEVLEVVLDDEIEDEDKEEEEDIDDVDEGIVLDLVVDLIERVKDVLLECGTKKEK